MRGGRLTAAASAPCTSLPLPPLSLASYTFCAGALAATATASSAPSCLATWRCVDGCPAIAMLSQMACGLVAAGMSSQAWCMCTPEMPGSTPSTMVMQPVPVHPPITLHPQGLLLSGEGLGERDRMLGRLEGMKADLTSVGGYDEIGGWQAAGLVCGREAALFLGLHLTAHCWPEAQP